VSLETLSFECKWDTTNPPVVGSVCEKHAPYRHFFPEPDLVFASEARVILHGFSTSSITSTCEVLPCCFRAVCPEEQHPIAHSGSTRGIFLDDCHVSYT
jgi:hypothetical protein